MHGTLKAETTKQAAYSAGAQQQRVSVWGQEFNQERPHEGLGQVVPQSLYERSKRLYGKAEPAWAYDGHWALRRVRSSGEIKWQGRLRFIGEAFCGEQIGLVEVAKGRHQVYL